jgi:hypothetical protein
MPSIGTLTLDFGNFLSLHPALINEVAGHALAHALYSHIRRAGRGRISRRQARKMSNRKRRWFVDNIIMHHKRLHDRNRELLISNARTRALARRKAQEKQPPIGGASPTLQKDRDQPTKWRDTVSLKQKGAYLRGRSDARRLRARSRWLTVAASVAS